MGSGSVCSPLLLFFPLQWYRFPSLCSLVISRPLLSSDFFSSLRVSTRLPCSALSSSPFPRLSSRLQVSRLQVISSPAASSPRLFYQTVISSPLCFLSSPLLAIHEIIVYVTLILHSTFPTFLVHLKVMEWR